MCIFCKFIHCKMTKNCCIRICKIINSSLSFLIHRHSQFTAVWTLKYKMFVKLFTSTCPTKYSFFYQELSQHIHNVCFFFAIKPKPPTWHTRLCCWGDRCLTTRSVTGQLSFNTSILLWSEDWVDSMRRIPLGIVWGNQ